MTDRLADIFQKDVLTLSGDDYKEIVAYYREFRGQFNRIKKDGTIKKARKPRTKKGIDPNSCTPPR